MENFSFKYKKKLLETFKRFVDFLNNNGIQYWAAAGTCLGAVRHKDIIPWDDDIDIYIKREDIDILYNLKDELKKYHLKIISINDYGYNHSFLKVCDDNTTIWESETDALLTGVWIDVFSLYTWNQGSYGIGRVMTNFSKLFLSYQRGTFPVKSRLFKSINHFDFKKFIRVACDAIYKIGNKKRYKDYIDYERTINQPVGNNLVELAGTAYAIFNKEWFDGYKEVEFSDFTVKIPVGYHEYLTQLFGNYMELPPEGNRVLTHSMMYVNLKENIDKSIVREHLKNKLNRIV